MKLRPCCVAVGRDDALHSRQVATEPEIGSITALTASSCTFPAVKDHRLFIGHLKRHSVGASAAHPEGGGRSH